MANSHGGARVGAGRKPKAAQHEEAIQSAESLLADQLPKTIENLIDLADGGLEEVKEEWELAGTILVDSYEITTDKNGKSQCHKVKKQLFPEAEADEMVLVKKSVVRFAPDLKANVYIADRIMGRPTQRIEVEDEPEDELDKALEGEISKIWGAKPDSENAPDSEGDEEEALANVDQRPEAEPEAASPEL
jgi:hypothetical protein